MVPDAVDALHRKPCLVHDVPFLSSQQVTDQRAILPSLPSAYRFKRPAGLRSAGQMSPDLQKQMAEDRTPQREQMKAAPTDPVEEALAMKNFWPDNRINLISKLLAILDKDDLDHLLECPKISVRCVSHSWSSLVKNTPKKRRCFLHG
jgi:hypothetical protein